MSDKINYDPPRSENGLRRSIENLPGSLIRHVAEPNMGRDGLLKLWFGEPDVPTPQFIKDAATAALADNQVFYAQNRGVPGCTARRPATISTSTASPCRAPA